MIDLYLTRTRRELLRAVGQGRVYRTAGGQILRRSDGGINRRADATVREVEAAGWVHISGGAGTYELTDAGRLKLAGAS